MNMSAIQSGEQTTMKRWAVVIGLLLVMIGWRSVGLAAQAVVPPEITQKVQTERIVRVIVRLGVQTRSEGTLNTPQAVGAQRQAIASAQTFLLAELTRTGHRMIRRFQTIPFIVLEVEAGALAVLERSSLVIGVAEDRLDAPLLPQSGPLVEADQAWAAGFDGTGWAVAILDTGVDNVHPFLSGKVLEEACFSASGGCPDGSTTQIGPGAGVPCTYAVSGCRHGTHVAGIAAGQGDSFSGVANGASLIAIQVFSRFTGAPCAGQGEDPCALSFVSDQIAGLEHVFGLGASLQIASANMSLGGGRFTNQESCDAANAARKAAIDNLRSLEIATAVASGNDGFIDAMSAPACISTAVSVGSTTKTDSISFFSNSVSFLSLLAPGSSIFSSFPNAEFGFLSGTSMATPHVAGAWAILKQSSPAATVSAVLDALQTTGLPITDPRNGVPLSRIRILEALDSLGGPITPEVIVDIRPRGEANRINPNSDKEIRVAILTGNGFNAATVDPNTVRFGATGTEAAPVNFALRDVDGDGDTDMVLRFEIQDTGIKCGDTSASLTGRTFSGLSFSGSDSIKTVRCDGT
jgi:subtilisin